MTGAERPDVLVLGAGPAGAITARTLAGLGYAVVLVSRPRRTPGFEGFGARTLDGLERCGCATALARIGPAVRRDAHWNGESFGGNREWLVRRSEFDQALLEDAGSAGVQLLVGSARSIRRDGGRWRVEVLAAGGGRRTAVGDFLVEARGRAAPRPPAMEGPRATALAGTWHLAAPSPPVSALESTEDGWLWYAAFGHEAMLQVVVDSTATVPGRRGLEPYYRARLAAAPAMARRLSDAGRSGTLAARYAQPTLARQVAGPDYLRVGDAAFAVDPLSGHGAFEAVAMAMAAVPVIRTVLERPGDAELALEFYRARIGDDFVRKARIGRDFHRMEQRWPGSPFWSRRRDWPDEVPAHAAAGQQGAHIEWRAVVEDGFIVRKEVIVTPDQPRGVWRVAGVPLVELVRSGAPAARRAWARGAGLDPDSVVLAEAWLRRHWNPAAAARRRTGPG